jgi:chorismate-pyruvate lyase
LPFDPTVTPTPTYAVFVKLFPQLGETRAELISASNVPEPFRTLLVHPNHMTVTVEKFFRDRVEVLVRDVNRSNREYARDIRLALSASGRIVQLGVVMIDLSVLSPPVRDAILAERTPLGRVLIEHGVLTVIEPVQFLKVLPGPELCREFECPFPAVTYGRIGVITADGHPAVEVLEIMTPNATVN